MTLQQYKNLRNIIVTIPKTKLAAAAFVIAVELKAFVRTY